MRNGTKRFLSLATALVMACSLMAAPAAAEAPAPDASVPGPSGEAAALSGEQPAADALPVVTITENKTQTKYIFANSEYNNLDTWPMARRSSNSPLYPPAAAT